MKEGLGANVGANRSQSACAIPRLVCQLWALPLSLPGLLLYGLTLATGGQRHHFAGVLSASGGFSSWWMRRGPWSQRNLLAITVGHVIIARDASSLHRTLVHELEHVRQGERWGIFFPLAYVIASLVALARGGHYYDDNCFEIAACRAEADEKKSRSGQFNHYLRERRFVSPSPLTGAGWGGGNRCGQCRCPPS